jgi:hypothetical protein
MEWVVKVPIPPLEYVGIRLLYFHVRFMSKELGFAALSSLHMAAPTKDRSYSGNKSR